MEFTGEQLKEIRDLFEAQIKLSGRVCLNDVARKIFGIKNPGGTEHSLLAPLADQWGYARTKRNRFRVMHQGLAGAEIVGKTYFYRECVIPDWVLILGEAK